LPERKVPEKNLENGGLQSSKAANNTRGENLVNHQPYAEKSVGGARSTDGRGIIAVNKKLGPSKPGDELYGGETPTPRHLEERAKLQGGLI